MKLEHLFEDGEASPVPSDSSTVGANIATVPTPLADGVPASKRKKKKPKVIDYKSNTTTS